MLEPKIVHIEVTSIKCIFLEMNYKNMLFVVNNLTYLSDPLKLAA